MPLREVNPATETGASPERKPNQRHTMKNTASSMKMKTKTLGWAALALLATGSVALAQRVVTDNAPLEAGDGLIGQNYSGLTFSYLHHVDGAPNVEHRYGFDSNMAVAPHFDARVSYDYTTASVLDTHLRQHDAMIGAVAYTPVEALAGAKPFVSADVGWEWYKGTAAALKNYDDSFAYRLGTGAELVLMRHWTATPYVAYEERPHFAGSHEWDYGLNTTYRFRRGWSGTVGAQIDDQHNLTYTVGVNQHF